MNRHLCLVFALLELGIVQATGFNTNAPLLPNPQMTPGDVLIADVKLICQSGYTKTVRNVPSSLKNQVYRAYGVTSRAPSEFEIDHLISLELGGSNSVRNLWPQSYKTMPLNAHVKDRLENRLHDLACKGTISMQEAQQAIAQNWEAAYIKYIGPLPGGASAGTAAVPKAPPVPTPPVTPLAATPGAAPPNADGSCPVADPVKISKAGLYHLPTGDGSYSRTHAVQCFPDAGSAAAAGYRGIK